jgi:hypothetical protein
LALDGGKWVASKSSYSILREEQPMVPTRLKVGWALDVVNKRKMGNIQVSSNSSKNIGFNFAGATKGIRWYLM